MVPCVNVQAPELKWSDAQLVVARYDEDLRWLDALPGDLSGETVRKSRRIVA